MSKKELRERKALEAKIEEEEKKESEKAKKSTKTTKTAKKTTTDPVKTDDSAKTDPEKTAKKTTKKAAEPAKVKKSAKAKEPVADLRKQSTFTEGYHRVWKYWDYSAKMWRGPFLYINDALSAVGGDKNLIRMSFIYVLADKTYRKMTKAEIEKYFSIGNCNSLTEGPHQVWTFSDLEAGVCRGPMRDVNDAMAAVEYDCSLVTALPIWVDAQGNWKKMTSEEIEKYFSI